MNVSGWLEKRLAVLAIRDHRTPEGELEFLIESAEKWNPAPPPERVSK